MRTKGRPSVYKVMMAFLSERGSKGARLTEIYAAVRDKRGELTSDTSMRAVLYNHLTTRRTRYLPKFERFKVNGESRYRIAQQ